MKGKSVVMSVLGIGIGVGFGLGPGLLSAPCAGGSASTRAGKGPRGSVRPTARTHGDLVLRATRAALLTDDRVMADNSMVAACVSTHSHHLSSVQVMIVCLLGELRKGRNSVWYPYLSQLPSYYTILPTFNDFGVKPPLQV